MGRTLWRAGFLCAFTMGYTGNVDILWPILPMWVVAEGFEFVMHTVRAWDRLERRNGRAGRAEMGALEARRG